MAFGAFGATWGAWGAVLPAVQRQVGVDDGRLGLLLLGTVAGSILTMRAFAGPIERLGPAAVPVSLVALAALLVPVAANRGAVGLFCWLCGFGVVSGLVDVSMNSGGAALERDHRVSVLPTGHGCFALGVLGGGLAAGLLRQVGLTPPEVLAVVATALLVAAMLPVPAGPGAARPLPDAGGVVARTGASEAAADGAAAARSLQNRGILLRLGALCALAFLLEDALENWASVHLEHTFHARPAISGLAPAVFGLSAGVTRLTLSRWSGRHSAVRVVSRGGVLAAVGLLAAAIAPDAGLALVGLALAGVGLASVAPLLFGAAGAAGGTRSVSVIASVGYVGFVLGPPMTGGIAGVAGLRAAFAVLAAVALVLAFAARQMDR